MNEAQIKRLIHQEIYKANNASRFNGVQSVVDHFHTGIDSPKINEDNIINGTKNQSLIIMNENETFQIKNVQNISRLSFYGYAADNAGGGGATKRAVITGEVAFGTCFRFTGAGSVITPNTVGGGDPFTQGCNFMYIDAGSQRVGADSEHFATATDGTTIVVSARVVAVSLDSISITVELETGWQITGSLLLT